MNSENLLTADKKENLMGLLDKQEYDSFFRELDELSRSPVLESSISEVHEEWRKLRIARRNNLMDDEQIHLAILAFFRKKIKAMSELEDQE